MSRIKQPSFERGKAISRASKSKKDRLKRRQTLENLRLLLSPEEYQKIIEELEKRGRK